MPPGSDAPGSPEPVRLPQTWRPYGARLAVYVFGGMLIVLCGAVWVLLDAEVRAEFTNFQRVTVVVIAVLLAACWFAVSRSRVVAADERLVVVNGFRKRAYTWAEVVGVSLPRGAPWARLDLSDGSTETAFAIQGSDGARARRAIRELRAIIDQQSQAR